MIKFNCKFFSRLKYLCYLLILGGLLITPVNSRAQENDNWPPFDWETKIEPLEDNRIKITIHFYSDAPWPMLDLALKIPLPANSRFVEASASATTTATFDGREITFFTNTVGPKGEVENSFFIIEPTPPGQTQFTIRPWVSWKGNHAGDYLFDEITLDAAAPFLNWQKPYSRVRLYTSATVSNGLITYFIYEESVSRGRIWDVSVKMPLPANTNFLTIETPSSFTGNFTDQEANFFSLELPNRVFSGPFIMKVQVEEGTGPFIYTQSHAYWTNVEVVLDEFGSLLPAKETVSGGFTIVEPGLAQWVVSDTVGDVPEGAYDLTNLTLQRDGETLKITFYTAEDLPLLGTGSRYRLYLDIDCSRDTGEISTSSWRNNFGMDYRITYKRPQDQMFLHEFNPVTDEWDMVTELGHWADRKTVTVWLPYEYLVGTDAFCWVARADSPTFRFRDILPDNQNLALTRYEINWDIEAENAKDESNVAISTGSYASDFAPPTEPSAPDVLPETERDLPASCPNIRRDYWAYLPYLPAACDH